MKDKYSKENIELVISNSKSIKECLFKLDRPITGDNYNFINKLIKKYNLSTTHFLSRKELKEKSNFRYTFEDIFSNPTKCSYTGNNLKDLLYKKGLKERKCELCGQDENWRTGKINLILDHINGIHNDNRLENLRIVCPNCDATLPTYKGKNIKIFKKEKPNQKLIKINKFKNSILNSKIDFSKKGWGVELGKYLNLSACRAIEKTKKYMPEFYKEKCFKHKDNKF